MYRVGTQGACQIGANGTQILERFRAKWIPVRVKKTRQNKNLEPRSDSIGTEMALGKQERTSKNNRGRAMADETATLAAYVANLKFEDIPHQVLERAKVLTLDFLGSAIRARRDAESTASLLNMLAALALDGKGESTVFGDAKAWTPAVAA